MRVSCRRRILVLSSSLAAALALTASSARAGSPQPEHESGPCAADRAKLCGDVKPGGGSKLKCLMSHEQHLAPECQAALKDMKARRDEITESCADDAEKLCKDIEPGRGRVIRCLAGQESKLTPDCRAEVEKAKASQAEAKAKVDARKDALEQACAGDIPQHCAGVEKGKGRIVQCLKTHESHLTPGCKAALP